MDYSNEVTRSSEKWGWIEGWGTQKIGAGKILEANN